MTSENKKEFDIIDFCNVTIPSLLLPKLKNYYVKGGRAYNAYFKNKIDSIDYDIVTLETGVIKSFMEESASKYKLILIEQQQTVELEKTPYKLKQYGFQFMTYDKTNDIFIIDVLEMKINENDVTNLNNILYYNFDLFVNDVLKTCIYRYNLNKRYKECKSKNNDDSIYTDLDNFNNKYGSKIEFSTIIPLYEFAEKTIYILKKEKNTEYFVTQLQKLIDTKNIDFNTYTDIYSKFTGNNEPEIVEAYFNDVLSGYNTYSLINIEAEASEYKYIKTERRKKKILSLDWSELSDVFKIYIIQMCNTNDKIIKLFNISSTCNAVYDCNIKNIILNVNQC